MKIVEIPIRTKIITIVDINCPIDWFNKSYEVHFKRCTECGYFVHDEALMKNNCKYNEYEAEIIEKHEDTDDDDFGGMLDTLYDWVIKCSKCDSKIMFTSGFSHIRKGDFTRCKKCNTLHTFLKDIKYNELAVFAVSCDMEKE